jgi:hypothetical protein
MYCIKCGKEAKQALLCTECLKKLASENGTNVQEETSSVQLAGLINLMRDTISYFVDFIRDHELTNYCDESDVNNPREVECYLVPKSEVDSLQEQFNVRAMSRWGLQKRIK